MTDGTSSRQDQILKLLLNARRGMSLDEIASALNISRNAVNQHVVSLESSDLIKKDTFKITGGRPSRNYVLTEKGINRFPKQYAWFCNLMLAELKAEMGEEAFGRYMARLGAKFAQTLMAQFNDKEPGDRITALVETMQALGYHATEEQNAPTPSIRAFNCVYHDLAQQFPELCEFDRALMSTLLNRPIEQTECMARNDCSCKFLIKNN
ncbi:MAG: HTH domain-containing protein [Methylobacter sp.]|uniref:helix-turn-helix transcriptional regulator n=1 Tax=Methylobacter sp. TaxID=2051955 RepID=UPI0025858328|nr:HTH domain-containing protein [Methylobacter sp.]MCL7420899.1 HTH domain-containing protein [Methylobacter sp.]